MMSRHMVEQLRVSGKGHYTPSRSEARQAVVDAARLRQATAMDSSRKRRSVTVSQRPRRRSA
jgi:hypothetical protein